MGAPALGCHRINMGQTLPSCASQFPHVQDNEGGRRKGGMRKPTAAHHPHRTHLETGVTVHRTEDKEMLREVKRLSPGPPGSRERWDRSPGLSDFLRGLTHRGPLPQRGWNRAGTPSSPLSERYGRGSVSFDTKNSFTRCSPPRTTQASDGSSHSWTN